MKKAAFVFELIGFVLAGLIIGTVLDQVWGTRGGMQAIGLFFAFLLWVIHLWKKLQS